MLIKVWCVLHIKEAKLPELYMHAVSCFPIRFMQCLLKLKKNWFQLILLFFTQCVSIIESCQKKAELLINDLDLHVLVHNAFGKLLMMPSYYY